MIAYAKDHLLHTIKVWGVQGDTVEVDGEIGAVAAED